MALEYRIEHLGFAAENPALLAAWYVRVLGGVEVWNNGETPPAFFVRLAGGLVLEIYSAVRRTPETGVNQVAGFRHLALRVEDIGAARSALEAAGVVFTEPTKPAGGGGTVLFFRDPEGNLLHLVGRPPEAPLATL